MARNANSVKNTGTIDWKRKLTSRKFWLSIASFTAMLLVALGKSQETATQVTSLIMAGSTVIGYVIGEGLADGGHGSAEDGHGTADGGHGTADDGHGTADGCHGTVAGGHGTADGGHGTVADADNSGE